MRIVGGKFKGMRLQAPKGLATRPTTDRTRESLFNILQNKINFEELQVLDLFAGTGALGLEAISRGAEFCLFVEKANVPSKTIQDNINALGAEDCTKLLRKDALKLGAFNGKKPFPLIFCDPPYSKGLGEKAAISCLKNGWLEHSALFILEEQKDMFPQTMAGFQLLDLRKFGETCIGLFEVE